MQWLEVPAWKVYFLENRKSRVRPPAGIQVSKKQIVTSSLTYKDLILWGASVTERPQTTRARISNPVSGGQCHLIHHTILTLLAQFSIYVYTDGLNPRSMFIGS